MQKLINEVKKIKKLLSFIISAVLFAGLIVVPLKANAASTGSSAGVVSTPNGRLNVRRSGSTSSSIITSLAHGSYVTLISKSGEWWYLEYSNGKYGYCHGDYISSLGGSSYQVNVSSGTLNIRSGAGTSYSILGGLYNGEKIVVISSSNGWSRILYRGNRTGYVSNSYISPISQNIYLNLPNFKQTDPRWANVKIGQSGKTIAQIGCVTTGIAMMESYRTGTTIYPDAMSKKLSYSSSGNVYWPSHYTVDTNYTGSLKRIYNLLKSGKPVLLGAKTSSGSQHWVVVVGYEGNGSSFSLSEFKINDPATNSRTNLQQFFNAYPNFYKFFYY